MKLFTSRGVRELLIDLLQTAIWVLALMALVNLAGGGPGVYFMAVANAALLLALRANRRLDEK